MARLNRKHPLPLYVQLKLALQADILAQRWRAFEQLPSERELCLRFHVSRMTVRQALMDLKRDGLIFSRAGKGIFISEPKIDQQLRTLTGFSQEMKNRGSKPSSRVLEARIERAGDKVAEALRISPDSEVVLLSRVRLADDIPLAIEVVHLPHPYCPNLLRHDFTVESLYDVLAREYGLVITHAEQTIEAALANPRQADLLQVDPPAPVLMMQRSTLTEQGILVEYAESVNRGDRFKLHVTLALGREPECKN
jgi:GntR family transcriptional regulator, N-acetylglucosamine utilization regulator